MNLGRILFLCLCVAAATSISSTGAIAAKYSGNPHAPKAGTFYLNLGAEPTTLNPVTSVDLYATNIQGYIIENLLDRDSETNEWKPSLATSWKISPDGKVFTFTLRQGVQWHDGKPFTAEDVKFSFDAIFDAKYSAAHRRPYYEGLEKVEIVDPYTVKFYAKDKYFKNFEIAGGGLSIIPKHIYGDSEKGAKINKELIGTGPYLLSNYERGKKITLKRNEKWWGVADADRKAQWNFEFITFRFVKDETVALEMLKKGDFDYDTFTPGVYAEKAVGDVWGKKVFKFKVENLAPKSYGFIGWNLENPLFKEKKVRQALAHLVNRKLMIEKFRYGMSLPATGPWYQQSEYASKKVKPFEFDPKKALALLKEAGWEDTDHDGVLDKVIDGKKTSFRFTLLGANPDFMKYLTMFKEDAKKAGVDVEIKQLEWNSFIKLMDEHKFDAVTLGWGAGSIDLDPKQIWHSSSAVTGGSNFISYKNPEVDRLIDEARQTMDKKARIPKLRKIYEMIADDAPYAFLFNDKYILYGSTARVGRDKETLKYSVGSDYWWIKN